MTRPKCLRSEARKGLLTITVLLMIELALYLSVRCNPLASDGLVFLSAIVFIVVAIAIVAVTIRFLLRVVEKII